MSGHAYYVENGQEEFACKGCGTPVYVGERAWMEGEDAWCSRFCSRETVCSCRVHGWSCSDQPAPCTPYPGSCECDGCQRRREHLGELCFRLLGES